MDAKTYYHDRLDKVSKQVYHDIHKNLTELSGSFQTTRLPFDKLSEIYFLVRMEDPWIFYTNGFSLKYYDNSETVIMEPNYLFKKKEIAEHRKALASRLRKLLRPAEGLEPEEKEKFIHDLIIDLVKYDKLKKAYSHEIVGPLFHGIGVCEGIAKTVKLMCDELGIWCIIAISENNPSKGIKYRHTWNVVGLEKGHAHLDVTFDVSLSKVGIKRYDYFNITDTDIARDHEPSIYTLPACDRNDMTYYRRSRIAVTKESTLKSSLEKAAKRKKEYLFQWRGSYFTREVLKSFCGMITQIAEEADCAATLSVNMPQAVMYVRFSEISRDEPVMPDVTLEEANEGELYTENEEGDTYEET